MLGNWPFEVTKASHTIESATSKKEAVLSIEILWQMGPKLYINDSFEVSEIPPKYIVLL